MGPFIDSDHPDIKKGTVDQSFHDIFHFEILRKVNADF
jgi:DNA polymerase alpha subunit B